MLDGLYDMYTPDGKFLGYVEDDMTDCLVVSRYLYNKICENDFVLLEETRAHRARKVQIVRKDWGMGRLNLHFKVVEVLTFPIEKKTTKPSWEHWIVDLLGLGNNLKATHRIAKVLKLLHLE